MQTAEQTSGEKTRKMETLATMWHTRGRRRTLSAKELGGRGASQDNWTRERTTRMDSVKVMRRGRLPQRKAEGERRNLPQRSETMHGRLFGALILRSLPPSKTSTAEETRLAHAAENSLSGRQREGILEETRFLLSLSPAAPRRLETGGMQEKKR